MFDKLATLVVAAIFTTLLLIPLALVKYIELVATAQETRANAYQALVQKYDAALWQANADLKAFLYDSKALSRENIKLLRAANDTSIAQLREQRIDVERNVPKTDIDRECVLVRATKSFLFPSR